MFTDEYYEPRGWFWILEMHQYRYGSYLMDDFGNAIPYDLTLSEQRQESIRSYIF